MPCVRMVTRQGGWVIGWGYDQNKTGGHPERDELDRHRGGMT